MLAIHDLIPFSQLSSPPTLEVVTVKLELKVPLTVCLVYLPPLSSHSNLLSYLDHLLSLNQKTVILGDFNLPDINWESLSGSSPQSHNFCDLIFKYNITQFVTLPTHTKGNILDLILSNDPDLVHDLSIDSSNSLPPSSDHFKITFGLSTSTPPKSMSKSCYIQ